MFNDEKYTSIFKCFLFILLCDEIKTVREFTYLGDRVSADGGCEAAVTARTRCGLAKFSEFGELIIIIIMVIFKCYFSAELIDLS